MADFLQTWQLLHVFIICVWWSNMIPLWFNRGGGGREESCTITAERNRSYIKFKSLFWFKCDSSCCGSQPGLALTNVLLVVLALSSHGLLRSAVTVLRAPTQAVRHAVHLLKRLEPVQTVEDRSRMSAGFERTGKAGIRQNVHSRAWIMLQTT